MNEFYRECAARKSIANQARHKKNGSKSKRCSLPSDNLTMKQWKEKCGSIMSYNLGAPMTWKEFKDMPVDIQRDYLIKMKNEFGATAVDIAKMFAVNPATIRRHIDANNIDIKFDKGRVMSDIQRIKWDKFLYHEYHGGSEAQNPVIAELPEEVSQKNDLLTEPMQMTDFTLRFSGKISIDGIANSLRQILGDKSSGTIEIICIRS